FSVVECFHTASTQSGHRNRPGVCYVDPGNTVTACTEYAVSEAASAPLNGGAFASQAEGHRRWVRICHWLAVASFVTLAVSGVFILMVHPRLYLGEVGNDLTPALLPLPINNNHRPGELQRTVAFTEVPGAPVSAERNFEIFNQNGWARSLHFLAAWVMVVVGAVYLSVGIVGGHVRRQRR